MRQRTAGPDIYSGAARPSAGREEQRAGAALLDLDPQPVRRALSAGVIIQTSPQPFPLIPRTMNRVTSIPALASAFICCKLRTRPAIRSMNPGRR